MSARKRHQPPTIVEQIVASSDSELLTSLSALRTAIASDQGEHRTTYRKNLAEAYYLAFIINQDTDSKFQFESDHEWQNFANTRISRKDPAFLLAAVLGYLFGNQTRARRKKVSKLKKVFEPYFIRSIKPNEVGAIVVKGGVPELTRKASQFFEANKEDEVHPTKKRVTAAQMKFTFDPGKFIEQLTNIDGKQVRRGKFKITRKPNCEIAVEILSLNATA